MERQVRSHRLAKKRGASHDMHVISCNTLVANFKLAIKPKYTSRLCDMYTSYVYRHICACIQGSVTYRGFCTLSFIDTGITATCSYNTL